MESDNRPQGRLARREFLKIAGAAALGPGALPAVAGPFQDENEYLALIPVDKKLDPTWLAALAARGEPTIVTDPRALAHIGMPVGGLFAGTLYLGGDGKLWLWDVFNHNALGILPREVRFQGQKVSANGGANYVQPAPPAAPLEQGFALIAGGRVRPLERGGFEHIAFQGRYPVGQVSYRDADCPFAVELEAFSPFIPLDDADSSLPLTVMRYRVTNKGGEPASCILAGWLENAICLHHRDAIDARRSNRIEREPGMASLLCELEPQPPEPSRREDILFEDFESGTYEKWKATGTAFGDAPRRRDEIPDYQGDVGGAGRYVVNSHNTRSGEDVRAGDAHTGTLTSKPFEIQRRFINFFIGGGAHKGKTCLDLLVDGRVVRTASGRNSNRMRRASFDTSRWEGREARLRISDLERGGWGNVGVDQIVFSDRRWDTLEVQKLPDHGTLALAVLEAEEGCPATACTRGEVLFEEAVQRAERSAGKKLIGALGRELHLAPGESASVTFLLSWHFPNLDLPNMPGVGRHYAARFESAQQVIHYAAKHFQRLRETTLRWRDTWYDSSLPHWFLDRTMANTTTLATSTCYRLRDGRFWAWEGIGCCAGTCTHVWHYAQAPARLFPAIERDQRERVDLGIALHEDGGIGQRAGLKGSNHPAVDGQCGRILGAYREHQMSADSAFLERNWPRIRKAIEYLIRLDANGDGIVEGSQPNTLDAAWFGEIPFISSLYLAALRAGRAMAEEVGDGAFAERCRRIAERGASTFLKLFNGEYFFQVEDPAHPEAIGAGRGCYIDQVFGQSWAFQVDLGRLFEADKCRAALRSLWSYNFVPDVGPFREHFKRGRWYAMAGDAGLLMCTWPKGGRRAGYEKHWQYMYFNECMSGFEWQVAAHMIWEGMVTEGLAVGRAIHERYDARLRNPYNEIECSDHYARAMASYGAYLAACGFAHHGPRGYLAFAPRLGPNDFKAAFTAAEGWGSFRQERGPKELRAVLELRYGRLRLATLALETGELISSEVRASLADRSVPAKLQHEGSQVSIHFDPPLLIESPQSLVLQLT